MFGGGGSPVALPCCHGHTLSRGGPACSAVAAASLIYMERAAVAWILQQILRIMQDLRSSIMF